MTAEEAVEWIMIVWPLDEWMVAAEEAQREVIEGRR